MSLLRAPEWLTTSGAVAYLGKSHRTIRRWLADPSLSIRTKGTGASKRIHRDDLDRVNDAKDAYRNNPTFTRS
ncbi:hypothetical protein J2Y69_002274 [Microbacterium resistens]|uniref:Helix-turn-helix domain-containing protein n=1 Tax=Microbacterium resistens TaxID=156977 RepID=A0ABU1SDI1_9MICO|nr:hypothetical protein [Microbacterium resistens]